PEEISTNPNVRVATFKEHFEGRQSFTLEDLKTHLGEPTLMREHEAWWVGPAMYVKVSMKTGRPELSAEAAPEYRESSIQGQKWFSALLLGLGLLVAGNLIRILTTKVVLNDTGLRYNKRHVPWEAMTGLRRDDYARKGWVDLEYTAGGATRSLRLD